VGGEKGGAGERGAKRSEHLANRFKRKAPNGEFGQGTVGCGQNHRVILQAQNSQVLSFAKEFCWEIIRAAILRRRTPSRAGYSERSGLLGQRHISSIKVGIASLTEAQELLLEWPI